MIQLRVFRAIDDFETCQKFVEGHMKILKAFGITMITSANIQWFMDPNSYVIVAESRDDGRVLGGARVQVAGGKYPLPIIKAVEELDERIHDVVDEYTKEGVAELCGLWNSREIAGLGIGSVFLTRTAVAIAAKINVKRMFALCAAYTVTMAQNAGFEIATSLGDNGTFYYPKEDLVATGMLLEDSYKLDKADPAERAEIISLREDLLQIKTEKGRRNDFDLMYDLTIFKDK
jgi:hypothetical protein